MKNPKKCEICGNQLNIVLCNQNVYCVQCIKIALKNYQNIQGMPLKNKELKNIDHCGHTSLYDGQDILSAVEWLKEQIRDYPIEMGGEREGIINLVDKAFPDIENESNGVKR